MSIPLTTFAATTTDNSGWGGWALVIPLGTLLLGSALTIGQQLLVGWTSFRQKDLEKRQERESAAEEAERRYLAELQDRLADVMANTYVYVEQRISEDEPGQNRLPSADLRATCTALRILAVRASDRDLRTAIGKVLESVNRLTAADEIVDLEEEMRSVDAGFVQAIDRLGVLYRSVGTKLSNDSAGRTERS